MSHIIPDRGWLLADTLLVDKPIAVSVCNLEAGILQCTAEWAVSHCTWWREMREHEGQIIVSFFWDSCLFLFLFFFITRASNPAEFSLYIFIIGYCRTVTNSKTKLSDRFKKLSEEDKFATEISTCEFCRLSEFPLCKCVCFLDILVRAWQELRTLQYFLCLCHALMHARLWSPHLDEVTRHKRQESAPWPRLSWQRRGDCNKSGTSRLSSPRHVTCFFYYDWVRMFQVDGFSTVLSTAATIQAQKVTSEKHCAMVVYALKLSRRSQSMQGQPVVHLVFITAIRSIFTGYTMSV
jgi:hypothetical protein